MVSKKTDNQDSVYFGAWVTLEKENGEEVTYRMMEVGADEHDSTQGFIIMGFPLEKALFKKAIDDKISLKNEFQQSSYFIVNIRY